VPGESVYGEKRISTEDADGAKTEYRVWNPFRSKLAAAVLGGVDNIHIGPGSHLLYLGAASGTTVSHCADIVGPTGLVYAVEFSQVRHSQTCAAPHVHVTRSAQPTHGLCGHTVEPTLSLLYTVEPTLSLSALCHSGPDATW
jgi:hypothetical protein